MSFSVLEQYIKQHIQASADPVITFSWHGGEPTLFGLDGFKTIVSLQKKYQPKSQKVANALQTNGTLIDEKWCEFLADENFIVGLSLDGPREMHDCHRISPANRPTFDKVLQTYRLLKDYDIYCDLLCVVNAVNVREPLKLYRFFRSLNAPYITFLPLVERDDQRPSGVSPQSLDAHEFGTFLCHIFDEWSHNDIGNVKINFIEESARLAFGQHQALCIFRPTCGDIPVVEANGDVYCCDHFVNEKHLVGNILENSLISLLKGKKQREFGRLKHTGLPHKCRQCDVLEFCNGGCPKDRFIVGDDGEVGLNYLCHGYQMFFRHLQPFIQEVRQQRQPSRDPANYTTSAALGTGEKAGRNSPCPCGSGKKYKKCCLIP